MGLLPVGRSVDDIRDRRLANGTRTALVLKQPEMDAREVEVSVATGEQLAWLGEGVEADDTVSVQVHVRSIALVQLLCRQPSLHVQHIWHGGIRGQTRSQTPVLCQRRAAVPLARLEPGGGNTVDPEPAVGTYVRRGTRYFLCPDVRSRYPGI